MQIGYHTSSKDYGPAPYVANVSMVAADNTHFRATIWTGQYLQITLMTIPPCGEVGLEIHPDTDQFIYIEQGNALVKMGECKNEMKSAFPVPLAHTSRFPLLYITIRRGC